MATTPFERISAENKLWTILSFSSTLEFFTICSCCCCYCEFTSKPLPRTQKVRIRLRPNPGRPAPWVLDRHLVAECRGFFFYNLKNNKSWNSAGTAVFFAFSPKEGGTLKSFGDVDYWCVFNYCFG